MAKKYQKELDDTRADKFDLTEYEENFIRNPQFGPYENDEQFDIYHRFEFFHPAFIGNSVSEFKALTKKCGLSKKDYETIEKGILAFTNSSTVPSLDSALLYKSLIKKEPNILLNKFEREGEEITQLVQSNYFETFERFDSFSFNETDLIPENSLQIYMDCAEEITLKRLKEWVEYSVSKDGDHAWAEHYERILIYRGINNKSYYNRLKSRKDFLSLYKSLHNDFPFFEKNLLSSYTLSPNLAEQFMVGNPRKKSERRVIVEGHVEIIENRILTSFLVSPNFRDAQFEIICLPDERNLKIRTDFDNAIHANFTVYE